ncbi:MAG: HAD-superfamily hydrolase, subfamily variant 3 [Hyphomicrobiales bacterium]|nr:HAD-superfamily hydrolase, subfamily variant 3 [Hyphomicrobiales bacterium]
MIQPRLQNEPKAVIFDMDGLLVDTERLAMRALAETAQELGIDAPDMFCKRMIGVPVDGCLLLLRDRFGPNFDADSFLQQGSARMETFIRKGMLRSKPGVTELLDFLDASKLPRAIATSSSRSKAETHLLAAGIRQRFDIVVTRDDVERGKPYPDLFLKAASRLGANARKCLVLEDSYNGVRAAHAAGAMVVMVPDLLPPTAETDVRCAWTATDLHQVRRMLLDAFPMSVSAQEVGA